MTRQPTARVHPRPSGRRRRPLAMLLKLGAAAGIVGALVLTIAVAIAMAWLPGFRELMRSPNGRTVQIKAADGSLLTTLGPSYGQWLAFDDIPTVMVGTMVAVEDRRFYMHPGVDPIGIVRSAWVNLTRGDNVQGGSTITQQLARNLFLTNERSYARKLREIVLAIALEQRFTKREILELYLNRVYFGGGAYGIDAASRRFFGHSAATLDLPEAAVIAGLVKAPSRYAPTADETRAKRRAATVLAVLAERGLIEETSREQARLERLTFAPRARENNVRWFTDWVLAELDTLTDRPEAPLEVTTTLMPGIQKAAERAVGGESLPGAQTAIIAMSHDGAVRAMMGGRDYVSSIYNRAVAARRQPGSAFKLFVYLAALENGYGPDDMIADEPVRFGSWSPRNSTRGYAGPVTLREAFARSINTVSVKLASDVGFSTVARTAERFGITTPIDRRPAMALGSSEVTLLELTGAYAAVARGGREVRPYGITQVKTTGGVTLYEREATAPKQLVSQAVAAEMTDLLKAAVDTGTGRAAQVGRPLAGKTGTTSSNKDGWFIGFTGDLVAGVWMGRDDALPVAGLAGGRAPAKAFARFMSNATRGMPIEPLETDVVALELREPDAESYGLFPDDGWAPVPSPSVAHEAETLAPDYPAPDDFDGGPPGATVAVGPAEEPSAVDGGTVTAEATGGRGPAEPRLDQAWLDGVLGRAPEDASGGSANPM